MHVKHIVAAADDSDAGRHAARTAMNLATRCSARLTIMRVAPRKQAAVHAEATIGSAWTGSETDQATEGLGRWLQANVVERGELERIQLGAAVGIPGIEICRFAELRAADLVILGRKRTADMARLLLGDTADAVARRSPVPTLFVPQAVRELSRVLVALDGSRRGLMVLGEALDFARYTGASLHVITVENAPEHEAPRDIDMPGGRSVTLQTRVNEFLSDKGFPVTAIAVQRGDVVESVTTHCLEIQADALVIGHHRGGAPSVVGPGSTAQRLGHAAPCAVLTVPL
jgi:nucleotide-binding universal stress UspA family protein